MDGVSNQMKDNSEQVNTFEKIEILENATILFKDGNRAIFEAIFLAAEEEIIFGQILMPGKTDSFKSIKNTDANYIFKECGGIPKDSIKSIEAGTKKTVLKISE